MYRVDHKSFDHILMKARATDKNGREVVLSGTWVWAPRLSWYNETDSCWLTDEEWKWTNL